MALMSFRVLPEGGVSETQVTSNTKDVEEANEEEMDEDLSAEEPPLSPSSISLCRKKKDDDLFRFLRSTLKSEGFGASWGNVLDAGAGVSSMCFLLRGQVDSLIEVTADEEGTYGAKQLRRAVRVLDTVTIQTGNWRGENRRGSMGIDLRQC